MHLSLLMCSILIDLNSLGCVVSCQGKNLTRGLVTGSDKASLALFCRLLIDTDLTGTDLVFNIARF